MRTQIMVVVGVLAFAGGAAACTAFYGMQGDVVLAGNNEDFFNPRTKVWFIPAQEGTYGRVYFGFDNFVPQGGMNERGLFWDGFATAPRKVTRGVNKPKYLGNLNDKVMAECATVEEVLAVFDRYFLSNMEGHQLMFGDAKGDSVIIEGDVIVRKKGPGKELSSPALATRPLATLCTGPCQLASFNAIVELSIDFRHTLP